MKKIFASLFALLISVTTVLAAGITESDFLAAIESSTSYSDFQDIFDKNADSLGVDTSSYNELSSSSQKDILNEISGESYSDISELKEIFDNLVAEKGETEDSDSSANSGSSSGGSGSSSYVRYSIKGTVSLPDGDVAPSGGIKTEIWFKGVIGNVSLLSSSGSSGSSGGTALAQVHLTVEIPEGKSFVEYETKVSLRSRYSCAVGVAEITEGNFGYLNTSYSEVTELATDDTNRIDIVLEKPTSYISGTFDLDGGDLLSEDLKIKFRLIGTDGIESYDYTVILPCGEESVDFTLPAKADSEYRLYYEIVTEGINQQHICDDSVLYDTVYTDETLETISIFPEYREVVSGYIYLPDGFSAPKGGLDIEITGVSVVTVTILENESSVYYIAAKDDTLNFYPSVTAYTDVKYKDYELAVGDVNDVVLNPAYTVTGTVSVDSAVDGYCEFTVYVLCNGNEYCANPDKVTFETGETSKEFLIELDSADIGDVLSFRIYNYLSGKYVESDTICINDAVTIANYVTEYNPEVIRLKRRADGINTDFDINEAYFDYTNVAASNTKEINSLYIDLSNEVFCDGNVLYIVCYDSDGKMKNIKAVNDIEDNTIQLGWTLKDGYIKIIGLGNKVQPLFEELLFFK